MNDDDIVLVSKWKEKQNPKVLAKIIANHNNMIYSISKKYNFLGKHQEDLFCEGIAGLMIALEKFDPKHKTKFSTYAYFWIRSKINRFIEKVQNYNKPKKTKKQLNKEGHKLFQNNFKILEHPISQQYNVSNYMEVVDQSGLQQLNGENNKSTLDNMINMIQIVMLSLPYKENYIITHRWFNNKKSIKTVAKELNLSEERIRQLEKQAFQNIYKTIQSQFGNIRGSCLIAIILLSNNNIN